jgi:hypothetical protein
LAARISNVMSFSIHRVWDSWPANHRRPEIGRSIDFGLSSIFGHPTNKRKPSR